MIFYRKETPTGIYLEFADNCKMIRTFNQEKNIIGPATRKGGRAKLHAFFFFVFEFFYFYVVYMFKISFENDVR